MHNWYWSFLTRNTLYSTVVIFNEAEELSQGSKMGDKLSRTHVHHALIAARHGM